jgi:hypothetical protein
MSTTNNTLVAEAKGLRQVYTIRRGFFNSPDKLQAVSGCPSACEPGVPWR